MAETKVKTGIEKLREASEGIKAKARADQARKLKKVKPKDGKVATKEPPVAKPEEVLPAEIDKKTGQLILTEKHKQLIKDQIAPTATKEELELFFMMAYRTRLDPLLRQLYFIKYGQGERAKVSYVTSIDGYRIIAHRTGDFAGTDEPRYEYDAQGRLSHCTVTVYKFVQGQRVGFSAKVKFSEYIGQNLWLKMPETMIAKVAEAHALRKAFPQDLSGIYTTDEMEQAEVRQNSAKALPPAPQKWTKQQLEEILRLLKAKGKTPDDLKAAIANKFNIADVKTQPLTQKQADELIRIMKALPDVDTLVQTAEEIFGTNALPQGTEEIDPNEIPEDLGKENHE